MKKLIVLFLAVFIQGCATDYVGPGPDLKLTGSAAQEEISKFEMDESAINSYLEMGPEHTAYTIESMQKVAGDVSPDAVKSFDTAKTWRRVQTISFGVALASLLGMVITTDANEKRNYIAGGYIGAAATIGAGIIYRGALSDGANEFNRDLRAKYPPVVGLTLSF